MIGCVQVLLQDGGATLGAREIFPRLLRAALVPVPLPQFVARRWLQHRAHGLRERLLDGASGVFIGQEVCARLLRLLYKSTVCDRYSPTTACG